MSFSAEQFLTLDLDVAIFGGGIAGLWLANRLHHADYRIALFETGPLGGGQTIASQGMIHGGMKYTLAGALSGASEAIADMPPYWRQCLCGDGDINLTGTRILSDHFFLWSGESVTSRLTGFFASKLIRGRVEPVAEARRPSLLRHPQFSGSLYKIGDMVLDVASLIADLAKPVGHGLFQYLPDNIRFEVNAGGELEAIIIAENQPVRIRAKRFVLTAGEGNEGLIQQLGLSYPKMQRRPLQQVMVKHHHMHRFYGHCLGNNSTPRLTISSHPTADHKMIWYLGGQLAEEGAHQTPEILIERAKSELADMMPWLDFSDAEWATLPVTRAEPEQQGLTRPDNAFASKAIGAPNVIVGWPTKLTLAPNMANQVIALLEKDGIRPTSPAITPPATWQAVANLLPAPPVAITPWDEAFPLPPAALPEVDNEN